jgi:uncharacterized RDD family membrane protein YckC
MPYSNFTDMNYFLVLLFALFLIISYKVLHILKRAIVIAILSAAFPFIVDKFFNMELLASYSLLYFMSLGVALYLIYEVLTSSLGITKFILKVISLILSPITWLIKALFKKKGKKE